MPTIDDVTPNSAVVVFVDDDGVKRGIDFLDKPYGLDKDAVFRVAQQFDVNDQSGRPTGASFRVMTPLHCLMSRVCNTAELPDYDTPHALNQLRVSVLVLHAFIETVVLEPSDPRGGPRTALKIINQLYKFCHNRVEALKVFAEYNIDAFEAAPSSGLGVEYEERGYPQYIERLRARRERFGRRTVKPT